ncbi:hypothetical protein BC829DRAFT_401634 [Chytridium lagenaria]|nr:hypothetical protein BC829DRAFT_401634 [Chytridium lagenaria]
MNLLMPPQGSAMSIWSRIILFVGLGVCLEWSMALLCLPSRGVGILGIAPLCQFLFLVPVMVGVVGMGHVENEKAKESMIAAFLNITFFQVFRYLLVILLFLLFQITEPITLIIIVSLIVPCIADAIIFAIMGIPFLRLHLLRTRTTALAILRTMTRPTALEATSMAAANAKIQAVDAWGAPVSTLGKPSTPSIRHRPRLRIKRHIFLVNNRRLLFTIPSRLLILAAPNNAGFIIPAVVAVSVKIIFTVTRFRVFATPTNSSRVAAEDALEEEDMAGDDQNDQATVQQSLIQLPIPRKSAIPLLAADHMSSSLASQASIGIAMIALLLLPEVTFPPSLYGSPSIKPATASVYNATGASTFPIFQNPSDKPHVALLPSMFAEPIPEPKTLIYRAIILLILEWVCGAIVAAFVASPFGIVYGPSQQAHTTHAALMGLTTPTVGSSSVTNSTGGTPGPGAGIVGGVDAKALRRSFSRRQSAVRVANLSTVTVDPRLAVISGLEFMRAMGVVGIALSCFWAAVWGLT